MAKVISPLQLSGSIGDLTISQTKFGGIAGLKPGPSREKVLTHENFRRTRRNAGEFKLAIAAATLLRRALGDAIAGVRHPLLSAHMNKLLHKAAMQDPVNEMGLRCAAQGDARLLAGFEFNDELPLDKALPVDFAHSLDIASGAVRLEIPSFIARRKKGFPKGATHFRIVSCAAIVDFAHDGYANHIKTSELLPLGKKTPEAICLEHRMKVEPDEVLVQVMGMEFYKVENGKSVMLKGGAMRILEAVRMASKESASHTCTNEEDMQEQAKEAKPYTAKELKEKAGTAFTRLPLRVIEWPLAVPCFACGDDPLLIGYYAINKNRLVQKPKTVLVSLLKNDYLNTVQPFHQVASGVPTGPTAPAKVVEVKPVASLASVKSAAPAAISGEPANGVKSGVV